MSHRPVRRPSASDNHHTVGTGIQQALAYGEMPIADGGTASKEFLRVTFGQTTTIERENVRAQLEEYCGLDTSGMSGIVKKLQEMVFTS